LEAVQKGDQQAAAELLPAVYRELRQLAAARMAAEPPGQTLQATALVHEAYLRLVRSEQQTWDNRSHFFSAAAEAMRRILVDNARRKQAQRHGGGQVRVDIDEIAAPTGDPEEKLLLVHEALEKLAQEDATQAEVVKLRYFVGLSHEEIAGILKVNLRTVQRYWAFAKVWLYEEIERLSR